MASLEESLVDILTGHAGLTSLVGDRVGPPPLAQESALPAITFFRVSTLAVHAHSGNVGLKRSRMQFDCWGDSAGSVSAVVGQLESALDHYRGTVAGVRIDAALSIMDLHRYSPETGSYRRIVDFYIWSDI